jgi:hypothetical protein
LIRISKKGITEECWSLLKLATNFATDRYFGNKRNKLSIFIEFIDAGSIGAKFVGECEYIGVVDKKKKFTIRLCRDILTVARKEELLRTLFHEIVHVKQYFYGDLYDYKDGRSRYGKIVYGDDYDYWESPWEIDAIGRSEGLVHMFNDFLGAKRS